jgi:hypothetical protein
MQRNGRKGVIGFTRLNPLQLPPATDVDLMIDEFLKLPVDSRIEEITELGESPLRAIPNQPMRPSTGFHNVTFDWDTSIRTISVKAARSRRRPISPGFPDIALREIEIEQRELRRLRLEPRDETSIYAQVFPLRKNEIPNVRHDPGILRPRKRDYLRR